MKHHYITIHRYKNYLAAQIIGLIATIGLLFGFYFNHKYCGDSVIMNLTIAMCFFGFLYCQTSTVTKDFTDKEEAIKYIESISDDDK